MTQPVDKLTPTAGDQAPGFALTAVASNQEISVDSCRGRMALLLFHDHHTADAVQPVQEAARTRYPLAAELLVASVVDLRRVPVFMRAVVEVALNSVYSQAAQQVPEPLDPQEYVVILPDWKGKVTDRFGLRDVNKAPALVLIDAQGRIAGRYQGQDVGAAVARLLPPPAVG